MAKLKKQKKIIITAIVLNTIIINLLALAVPIFTLQVYDRILIQQNLSSLLVLSVCALIAILLEAVLRVTRNIIIHKSEKSDECKKFNFLTKMILNVDRLSLENYSASAILDNFKIIPEIYNHYYQIIISKIDFIFLFVYLGVIFYLSPILSLVPALSILILVISIYHVSKLITKYVSMRSKADQEKYDAIYEILKSFTFIKSNSLENKYLRKFEYHEKKSALVNDKSSTLSLKIYNFSSLIPQLNIIGMASIGAYQVIHNHITMGTLIASIIISGRLIYPLNQGVTLWLKSKEFTLTRKKLKEFSSLKRAIHKRNRNVRTGLIEIKDLIFTKNNKNLLNNVNLSVSRGQSIAIVRGNQVAKTALLRLITGAYTPTSGTITIDHIQASDICVDDLNYHLAYLSFESAVAQGTVFENITCFKPVPAEEVHAICKLLGIHQSIMNLPYGYETQIYSKNNEIVFPGLKQQICLARTLIPKPKIIVYNNADKNLDVFSYNNLFSFLGKIKQQIALILITNDKNIASLADVQYSIRNGELLREEGESIKLKIELNEIRQLLG